MKKVFIGIDPGKSGAIAFLYPEKNPVVLDWIDGPIMAREILKIIAVRSELYVAALEKVGAFPGQGVNSCFNFGANYGWWIGFLDGQMIPFRTVRPQEWQKGIVPRKKNKTDKPSLEVARRLFPTVDLRLKKHDGRADALLIADWLRRQYGK